MAPEVPMMESLIMEPVALNSFDLDVTKSMSKTELRQRIPFSIDDEAQLKRDGVKASKFEIQGEAEKSSGKSKFWGHDFHYPKVSNASDDGYGFLPGLMKQYGFGSPKFKEKDLHALEHMPRSRSHGFLPGLMKKAGFGSREFKDLLCKDRTELHHHHHQHGTRHKEIFGFEDATVHAREHDDLFGMRDMEKANNLFGFEDTEFERGEKGRDLFGSDDPDTLSFRRGLEIMGPLEADAGELDKTRHVFGDENAEDSDYDV